MLEASETCEPSVLTPWTLVALLSLNGFGAVQQTDPSYFDAEQDQVVVLDEVEVTARRGSTKIRPEREYDAGQIDAQGAYDIGEVMRNAPRSFGPGQEPVVIINGVPVSNPSLYYVYRLTLWKGSKCCRRDLRPPMAGLRRGGWSIW